MAVSVAVALIQSRLDYPNSVCHISAHNFAKLQRIQNVDAHIVTYHQSNRPSRSHLSNLYWFTIKHRINFKIATLTCKPLATQPGYLHTKLNTYQPVCSLRSRDNHLLAKPSVYTSTRRSTLGDRAFSVAAARAWNSLPSSLRAVQSLTTFRRRLKTELFDSSFT